MRRRDLNDAIRSELARAASEPAFAVTDELVEHVARRLCASDDEALLLAGVGPIPWDSLTDADRDQYLRRARVACEAAAAFDPTPITIITKEPSGA